MIKRWWFVFSLLKVNATLSDVFDIQFQGSEMSLGIFQDFMDGYVKP